jgi:hypothetical protein
MTALQAVLVVVFGVLGLAKLLAVPYMREAAAHLGFSVGQYRAIGLLELAAVTGLVLGVWWHGLALAAAGGLVLLLCGAVATHVRNHDGARHLVPALAMTAVALCYLVV